MTPEHNPVPQVQRNPPLTADLVDSLVELCAAVASDGSTVECAAPVTVPQVRLAASSAFQRVREGTDDLVVAWEGARLVGMGLLVTNEEELQRHWASISSLQRHPDHRGRGIGAAVLAELEAAARDRSLARVTLAVPSGTGRERWFTRRGYLLEATLAGRLRVDDRDVDLLVLSKALHSATTAPEPVMIQVRRLDLDLPLPALARPYDAGLDLRARHGVTLEPGQRAVVGTGIAIALEPGYVGLVHPRSGLAARHGLSLVNAPGTIDAGYRGEVQVVLINLDPTESIVLSRGDRIAQLVVQRVAAPQVVEVDTLPVSQRGEGGFGSTGR